MNLVEAVMIGILQGILEWIPVSSEAAISIAMTQIFGTAPIESLNTAVFLHIGTMFSALLYFREDYIEMSRNFIDDVSEGDFELESRTRFLVLSTAVTGALGGGIYVFLLEALPESPSIFAALTGLALLVTGVLKLATGAGSRPERSVTDIDSVLTGLLQALAIVPGISRSGATTFGFLYRGFDSKSAFRLSFLMSVPAVLGAQVGLGLLSGFEVTFNLVVAGVTAFLVGAASIEAVLNIAEKTDVAYLCFGLAAVAFASALL
jgi:undecaprenyl-diphosphatase